MTKPTRVLVLGGGYVAIWLTRAVRGAIRRGEVELTVVDRNNYHTFHGLVPEMLTGKIQAGQIISPARRLFAPGRFIAADIERIDLATRTVSISRILDGRPATLEYDELVLNVGSVDDLTRYRGVGEHTMRLKSYFDCIRVRNHLLAMLEMAELEPDAVERRRLLHFVVAGGNYAGIETAAELSEFVSTVARRDFPNLDLKEVTISVVHAGPQVLPELGQRFPSLAAYAERQLTSRGVTLLHDVKLQAATPQEAVLSDGRRLPTRTIISCTGTAQNPLLDALPFPREAGGRLQVEATGVVSREHRVWAAGDCAGLPMTTGQRAPPLALYAMHAGTTVGRNVLRAQRGQALEPYAFTGMGDCCVLGHGDAVGQLYGIPLRGLPAWLIWRACMILYLPTWAKRLRTLYDWLLLPFFGPDIASVNASDSVGVVRHLFEPGQEIIRQGEVGRAMYIIQSGRVEVVQERDGQTSRLAELGPGEHFGEIAVLKDTRRSATVRALDQVALLRISREETKLLTRSFQGFSQVEDAARARAGAAAPGETQ